MGPGVRASRVRALVSGGWRRRGQPLAAAPAGAGGERSEPPSTAWRSPSGQRKPAVSSGFLPSPLTDSNRRPLPYHRTRGLGSVPGRGSFSLLREGFRAERPGAIRADSQARAHLGCHGTGRPAGWLTGGGDGFLTGCYAVLGRSPLRVFAAPIRAARVRDGGLTASLQPGSQRLLAVAVLGPLVLPALRLGASLALRALGFRGAPLGAAPRHALPQFPQHFASSESIEATLRLLLRSCNARTKR
jgi:hypothetical protein